MTHRVVVSHRKFINIDVARRLLNFFRISSFSRYFSAFIFKVITVILLLCLAGKTECDLFLCSDNISISHYLVFLLISILINYFSLWLKIDIFRSSEISNVSSLINFMKLLDLKDKKVNFKWYIKFRCKMCCISPFGIIHLILKSACHAYAHIA